MKTLNDLFREIICENEGGDSVALKFSDPDGVKSGKSGWSFGVSQFYTRNNSRALDCLRECGFTEDEIHGLVDQTANVKLLEHKLFEHADIIARYDNAQLKHCLDAAGNFAADYKIAISDSAALLMLADTVNQYGSLGNGSASYCRGLDRPVTADDVLAMKLTWKYSQTEWGRKDTIRRYNNVMKVINNV